MKPQKRTAAFSRFRRMHTEFSDFHWAISYASEFTISHLGKDVGASNGLADKTQKLVSRFKPSFPDRRIDITIGDAEKQFPEHIHKMRVYLLLAAASNLEAYLKEIIEVDLIASGFGAPPDKLSVKGIALGAPILESNTLTDELRYARDFFEVDIADELSRWGIFYRIRSNMAHTGGRVTARTIKELPDRGLKTGDLLSLEWDELKDALQAAFSIADKIDRKVYSQAHWDIEFFREASLLKKQKILPKKYPDFKRYTGETLGIDKISKATQKNVRFRVFALNS